MKSTKNKATPKKQDNLPHAFHRMVARVLAYRPPKNDARRAACKRKNMESTG